MPPPLPHWLLPFCLGCIFGLCLALGLRFAQRKAWNGKRKVHPRSGNPCSRPGQEQKSSNCNGAAIAGTGVAPTARKPRQFLPRGALGGANAAKRGSEETEPLIFNREVLCEDALTWLESLPNGGLPQDSCVLTGIPDIHEVDAEGRMGLEGYIEWFQRCVKLILQKLPIGGRAIFMQTDVKVARDSAQGGGPKGGCYWQWVDKAHLVSQAAASVAGVRLLWHRIIFSGTVGAGGRSGSSAGYTHYLCFTNNDKPEALDGFAFPDVLRKGLSTWKSGSGAQSLELACAYLRAQGCSLVVDPFCGEGSVLAIANIFGMGGLGVEINKKRAKLARTLDGQVLLDADKAERAQAYLPRTAQIKANATKKPALHKDVESYDGSSPLHLSLDDRGSVLWYLPSFVQDPEDSPHQCFETLESICLEVNSQVPVPPKDTSGSNGRAQYYGVGPHLRANPRWCNAARPLEGDNLACVTRLQEAVEAAVASLPLPKNDAEPVEGSGEKVGQMFNSVLLNRYADGRSQVQWHADDEKCYGPSHSILIASVSLGAARYFELRRKPRKGDTDASAQQRKRLCLLPGSLLVMAGPTQAEWQHCIPADDACGAPRINLTFRRIVGDRRRGEASV